MTLKNEVRQHWEDPSADSDEEAPAPASTPSGVYGEEEKHALRQSLYQMVKEMGGDAAPVRLQLIECIRIIAVHDYPDR